MDTKKYIIEIPDNTAWIQWVKASDKDEHVCFDFKYPEDLTPYTEPDTEQVREDAFKNGYDAACKDIDVKSKINAAYRKGLEDAWEAARKIDHMSDEDIKNVFGCGFSAVFETIGASEAIEKIRQYEQEEIKVGDEVEARTGKAVIIEVLRNGKTVRYMYSNASTGVNDLRNLTLTGRYFPEIAEVLKKMQEG